MPNSESFSRRKGYAPDPEITIREEAPQELRHVVVSIAIDVGLRPQVIYGEVCSLLSVPSEQNPLLDFDNEAVMMVRKQLARAEWFEIYDLAEVLHRMLGASQAIKYEERLNSYFLKKGIGWKMEAGRIESRGSEAFERTAASAAIAFRHAGMTTAAAEIHEALRDLSRRPKPDKTGAIQHSMAALECAARHISGDSKATLGEILRREPELLPKPLPAAFEKVWGYSSEVARHVTEGRTPAFEEAELVVGLAAAAATYLSSRQRQ